MEAMLAYSYGNTLCKIAYIIMKKWMISGTAKTFRNRNRING